MSSSRKELIDEFVEVLAKTVRELIDVRTRNCFNCMHFNEKTEECLKASPPQRPPIRVAVTGCDVWEDDGSVPF